MPPINLGYGAKQIFLRNKNGTLLLMNQVEMNSGHRRSAPFKLSVTITNDSDGDLTVLIFIGKNIVVSVAMLMTLAYGLSFIGACNPPLSPQDSVRSLCKLPPALLWRSIVIFNDQPV